MFTFPVAFRTQTLWGLLHITHCCKLYHQTTCTAMFLSTPTIFVCEIHMEGSAAKNAQNKTIFIM